MIVTQKNYNMRSLNIFIHFFANLIYSFAKFGIAFAKKTCAQQQR